MHSHLSRGLINRIYGSAWEAKGLRPRGLIAAEFRP